VAHDRRSDGIASLWLLLLRGTDVPEGERREVPTQIKISKQTLPRFDDREEILFYAASCEYGCFSNFVSHRVSVGGMEWKTAEHYFQAQKFAGTDAERAKELGNSRSLPLRKDWEKVKEGVMEIDIGETEATAAASTGWAPC
jgi:ribonucleotide reductase alpha subunit